MVGKGFEPEIEPKPVTVTAALRNGILSLTIDGTPIGTLRRY